MASQMAFNKYSRQSFPKHFADFKIDFVSVNFTREQMEFLFSKIQGHPDVDKFLDHARHFGKSITNNVHMTYDHNAYSSQKEMKDRFKKFIQGKVCVDVKAFYFAYNEKHGKNVAAFECSHPYFKDKNIEKAVGEKLPKAQSINGNNPFPHITVWVDHFSKPVMSNSLPHLYNSGQAGRVEFKTPVQISGMISAQKTNRQTHNVYPDNVYPVVRFDKYHAFEQSVRREQTKQSQRISSY